MSGSAFAVTHHAFSSGAGRTSDGNGSHASTLKSPSYTKSVSWQHYLNGVSIYQDGARDIGEINGGVVGMITPEVAFRADAGIQLGEHGYHNTSAMLSVEYRF